MSHSKNVITLLKDSKGTQRCELPISKAEWLGLLKDHTIFRPEWLKVLLSFYFMPGHKASCLQCASKYGFSWNSYNSGISALGRRVADCLDRFDIVDDEGKRCYWPVIMEEGRKISVNSVNQFEWRLRKQLVEAIGTYLIDNAIENYVTYFDQYWENEKYKWRAVKWFQNHWYPKDPNFASMLEFATAKTENLLASSRSYPRDMIIKLAKAAPDEVRKMFTHLFDESRPLETCVADFMNKAEELCLKHNPGDWKMHYQSTNAASTYLWLRYPDKYYIYKYSEYYEVNRKLGLDFSIKRNGKVSEMIKGFKMYDLLNSHLRRNPKVVELLKKHLTKDSALYPDPELRTCTIDVGFYISRWFDSAEKRLFVKNPITMTPFISQASEILKHNKNMILQGAPGTGKTYNTAALALAIIDGTVPERHEAVMARYDQLREEKRICFTTFHQSMDYEDFIEGIKPVHDGTTLRYEVEPGIFRRICEAAKVAAEVAASGSDDLLAGMNDNPTIWKVSLEGTGDNPTRRDCMKNGHIRIGWPEYGDIDFTEDNPKVTEGRNILRAFQNDMKIGDIVVSCWSANETDAIGIVTGDYEYRKNGGNLPRYRDVRWIVKDIKHDIREINNGKRMTLGTVYRLSISLKDLLEVIDAYAPTVKTVTDNSEKPFVLIIDEINRGNISKIFGELITLLEKDKRIGEAHEIVLSLPYSKQRDFGVPSNLYIIGTMNTTDRSTGVLDYAIRRRFAFMTVCSDRSPVDSEVGRKIFDNVEGFIRKYKYADMDLEDLMIGHSYFMARAEEELALKICYEVIPLLKEYIKDGILAVTHDVAKLYFEKWTKLETMYDSDQGTPED